MKQLDFGLEWLLDENWLPKSVKHICNIGVTNEEFEERQARSYGYKSVQDMDQHNYTKDKLKYLKYGDKSQGLI